jgi:mRNA interferase MazF
MKKPKQGDIIMLDLDPVKGHEQSGHRPALVVSNADFNGASNLTWVCPITNTDRKKPMDIRLEGTQTTGYILCEHIRAVDLTSRGYKATGDVVSEEMLLRVTDIIQGAVDVLRPTKAVSSN